MYYSSYHYTGQKDPLIPDNIGIIKYNVYYNIKTSHSDETYDYYNNEYNSGITIKNDIDTLLNNYQDEHIGKCLIVSDRPTSNDYKKILKISTTN